jgi:polyhydroxyalkanoate synthesis repressor PhaR
MAQTRRTASKTPAGADPGPGVSSHAAKNSPSTKATSKADVKAASKSDGAAVEHVAAANGAKPAAAALAGPRILKKYPNRRLYDTQLSSYITLADVKAMVLSSQTFEVRDAKTGEDLTRSILLQIILEEESGGVPIFSAPMLSQIIRFYGHSMQAMMGSYLEKNLQTFTEIQARLTEQSKGLLEPVTQTPEMWTKYLNGQAPAVQGLMGNYMEQSRKMFVQMQEQMAKQAGAMFPGMPGFVPPKR